MFEAVERVAPGPVGPRLHQRRRRTGATLGEAIPARMREPIEQLRQEDGAGNVRGVGLHAVIGEEHEARLRRHRRRDSADAPVNRLNHLEQRILSRRAEIGIERVVGMTQVPEVVLTRMNFAEIAEKQVPRLAAKQVDRSRHASLDAGLESRLQASHRRLIAQRVHVVIAECRVLAVARDDLVEHFRRTRVARTSRRVRSPAEHLDAIDLVRELRLRHVEHGDAILGAEAIERLVVGEFVRPSSRRCSWS